MYTYVNTYSRTCTCISTFTCSSTIRVHVSNCSSLYSLLDQAWHNVDWLESWAMGGATSRLAQSTRDLVFLSEQPRSCQERWNRITPILARTCCAWRNSTTVVTFPDSTHSGLHLSVRIYFCIRVYTCIYMYMYTYVRRTMEKWIPTR